MSLVSAYIAFIRPSVPLAIESMGEAPSNLADSLTKRLVNFSELVSRAGYFYSKENDELKLDELIELKAVFDRGSLSFAFKSSAAADVVFNSYEESVEVIVRSVPLITRKQAMKYISEHPTVLKYKALKATYKEAVDNIRIMHDNTYQDLCVLIERLKERQGNAV